MREKKNTLCADAQSIDDHFAIVIFSEQHGSDGGMSECAASEGGPSRGVGCRR